MAIRIENRTFYLETKNTMYEMKSTYLLFMGSISYFYYLCHERIVCSIIAYTGVKSLLLWALITIPIAYLISIIHKRITNV